MNLKDVIAAIERTAPPSKQASWDKSGLQVAGRREHITAMAVCLDATPPVIQEALSVGADFILSHHPLALKPTLPNRVDGWHKALRLLLCADVPLYAAHTSLDVNMTGPAGWFGCALGLKEAQPLERVAEGPWGYGEVGDLLEPRPWDGFLRHAMELLELASARVCGADPPDIIDRVAYCGGSGSSLLHAAWEAGAQVYVTGDIGHHAALDAAGMGLCVLDVGHHSLESVMMRHFALVLEQELTPLSVSFLSAPSPFRCI